LHKVVAGIFILQLSLDQIAAGAADAAGDEPLSSAALAGHAALIASLEDAPPAQTLSLICSIVIANAPHVQRERVLAHIKQQRTQQLYDKPPVVKGVTARTLRTGLFFVVLKLTVEGDAIAAGECVRITAKFAAAYAKSGQVARLPAENREADPSDEAQRFPLKHTACVPAPTRAAPLIFSLVHCFCLTFFSHSLCSGHAHLELWLYRCSPVHWSAPHSRRVYAYSAAGFSPTLP